MPIAFGEALTTQNDNLACVFFLAFVYYLMDIWDVCKKLKADRTTLSKTVVMSACIGFGYLTKPSVSVGMMFLAIILLVICVIRKDSLSVLMKLLSAAIPVMVAIIIPEALRNIQTFDAAFPSITGPRQLVGTLNLRYLFVNGVKNLSFNLPTKYIINSDKMLVRAVCAIASMMRVDINDASIAEDGRIFMLNAANDMGHDTAVNATILYVSLFCFFWFMYRRKNVDRKWRFYTIVSTFLFAAMCVIIRWEPFMTRYMIPYLALLCPMAAVWLEDICLNAKNAVLRNFSVPVIWWLGITGIVTLVSYHATIVSEQNISRPHGYFSNYYADYDQEYSQACELAEYAGANLIGLKLGEDDYEYPIRYMLKHSTRQIKHVMVDNVTGKYEDAEYVPDCILSSSDLGAVVEYHGSMYGKYQEWKSITVYMKQKE